MNKDKIIPKYIRHWTAGMPLATIALNKHLYDESINDWLYKMSKVTPMDIEGV